jgi:hypothetical protein
MSPLELFPFLILLAAVAVWVSAPIRATLRPAPAADDISALEAERDAKLAAVRDAELDVQTGKLSVYDHRALDARLRAEAAEALTAVDSARAAREDDR